VGACLGPARVVDQQKQGGAIVLAAQLRKTLDPCSRGEGLIRLQTPDAVLIGRAVLLGPSGSMGRPVCAGKDEFGEQADDLNLCELLYMDPYRRQKHCCTCT
jgi:hypothetical protein